MIRKNLRAFRALFSYPYKRELFSGIKRGWYPVFIKYPVYPKPRYGYNGEKAYPYLYEIIKRGKDAYKLQLKVLMEYEDYVLRIKSNEPDEVEQPYWNNPWFSGLDAVVLYGFIATTKPNLYLEIGSGNSTKFARRAISDHNLLTKIISVVVP
jgi:hypothetical protein